MPKKNGKRKIEHWQIISILLMLYDFVAVCGAYFAALLLRFDGVYSSIEARYIPPFNTFILPWAAVSVVIFYFLRMYNSMWRFASFTEFVRTVIGSFISSLLHTILITVLLDRMPLSYYLMGAVFQVILLLGVRFSFRFIQILKRRNDNPFSRKCLMLKRYPTRWFVLLMIIPINGVDIWTVFRLWVVVMKS